MFNIGMRYIKEVIEQYTVFTSGLLLSSLNMLLHIFLSMVFGRKGVPKIGGYRGES